MNSPYLTVITFIFALFLPNFFPNIHPFIRFLTWGFFGYCLWRWNVEDQKFKAELNRQFNLGYTLSQQGEYRQALQAFGEILQQPQKKLKYFDKLSATYFIRGQVFYFREQYLNAIDDLDATLKLVPEDIEVYLFRASAFQALGHFHAAIHDYESSIKLDPHSFKSFYYWGTLYQQEENYKSAIDRYSHAIKIHKTFTEAYLSRGYCYLCLSNYERALNDIDLAIEFRDQGHSGIGSTQKELDTLNLYSLRGVVHSRLEKPQKAMIDFNGSIELEQNNVLAYLGRGIYRCHQSQYSEALSDFQKAIKLNPSAMAYYNQAIAQKQLALKDDALVSLNKALTLQENMIAALYFRGNLFLSNGDELNGDADLQNAKDIEATKPELLDSDDAHAMFYKGIAFHRTGDLDITRESFRKALQICEQYKSQGLQKKIEETIKSLSIFMPPSDG